MYKTDVSVISLNENPSIGGRKDARGSSLCGVAYAPDIRMEGKLYSTWAFFYSSGHIETKVIQRRRSCFLWWCSDRWNNPLPATRLAMNFDIYVLFDGAPSRRFVESRISSPGQNLLSFSFGSLAGWNVKRFDFSGWSCHSTTYNGRTLTCSNQFYDYTYLPYNSQICP